MIVFYTDFGIPNNAAGCARGPFIFIRPKYKGDKGLLEHEKVHVRQWLRTFGLSSYMYALSKSYRLKCEVEAYKEQLKHYSEDRALLFAKFIADFYDLDVSVERAYQLLKG